MANDKSFSLLGKVGITIGNACFVEKIRTYIQMFELFFYVIDNEVSYC